MGVWARSADQIGGIQLCAVGGMIGSVPQPLIRTFRFRLKPTRAQHARLKDALEQARQLYNAALEERIDCYRKTGRGRSYVDQCKSLTELRQSDPAFARFPTVMQRGVLRQADLAFRAFFARGGFPRFKGKDWFKSLSWQQKDGWKFDGRFEAKGLGSIRVHQHRALPSHPLSARVKREGRQWYLLLTCQIEPAASNDNARAVGIDLGLNSFAALSDGTLIPNPRRGRRAQRRIRLKQRALARCIRGSKRRRKVRDALVATHLKTRRARRTFHFQTASALVRRHGLIAIESLNVKGLAKSRLARDVNDAAWGQFIRILCDTAERACVQIVSVDPRGTSQTCPDCGSVKAKALSERKHQCDCGCVLDRDVAAAKVVLHRAVHGPAAVNVGEYAERPLRKAVA